MFYVYTHSKTDGTVFYVGKGHGNRAWDMYRRSEWHQRTASKYGLVVNIIADCLDEKDAFDLERKTIFDLKSSGVKLVNMTDGGEGSKGLKWREESREKQRKNALNRNPEINKKIAQSLIGKTPSDEARKNMSSAQIGRRHSSETIEKMKLDGRKGRKHSEEAKLKMREAKKNSSYVVSDESRLKMSNASKGRKKSPETIEKMRLAAQNRKVPDGFGDKVREGKRKAREAKNMLLVI